MIFLPKLVYVTLVYLNLLRVGCNSGTCLPDRLIMAYGSWTQCNAKMTTAAEQGANVLIWFSINLSATKNGTQAISGALPDLDCIAQTARNLSAKGLSVTHLISVGGWNSPLPDARWTGPEWFRFWHKWNKETVARDGWGGFDGFDWDVEGNDKTSKAVYTYPILDLIGEMSVHAKRADYIVSMAPMQSFLDVADRGFDLGFMSPSWKPHFPFHGRNLFAYLLAFHGATTLPSGSSVPTFDLVLLQIYEGWSRANYELHSKNVSLTQYFTQVVRDMEAGWEVDFGKNGTRMIKVPRERLVMGLANGWAKPAPPMRKFYSIRSRDIAEAWRQLGRYRPRGFVYWSAGDEGTEVDGKPLFLAKDLYKILFGGNAKPGARRR